MNRIITLKEIDSETITYHNNTYRVWDLKINGEYVKIGEYSLEDEIIGWDSEPVDEEGFKIDEEIEYYADPNDDVEDVIRAYLDN